MFINYIIMFFCIVSYMVSAGGVDMSRRQVEIRIRRASGCRNDDVFQHDVIVLVGRVTLAEYMVHGVWQHGSI